MKSIILIFSLFTLLSCSSEKRLQKRIEKHGIKESISFMQRKYPQFFKIEASRVDTAFGLPIATITDPDSLMIDLQNICDSIQYYRNKEGGLISETKLLQLKIKELNGRLYLLSKLKADTIHDTLLVQVSLPCPALKCPDVPSQNESYFQLVILLIILLTLIILALLLFRKQRERAQ